MKAFVTRPSLPVKRTSSFRIHYKSQSAEQFDYGFKTMTGRRSDGSRDFKLLPKTGDIPDPVWELSLENFDRELKGLRNFVRGGQAKQLEEKASTVLEKVGWAINRPIIEAFARADEMMEADGVLPKLDVFKADEDAPVVDTKGRVIGTRAELQKKLQALKLDDKALADREKKRYSKGEGRDAPLVIKLAYGSLCFLLDVLFKERPIQRFWFLETVARMPYFSYISMLHLYESLGWFRAGSELRKVHFGEEYNELNHLLIMESLGGDQLWTDRFMGEHAAILYYFVLLLVYLWSPKEAYNLMALVEGHAVDTYGQFLDDNEKLLKSLPPTRPALDYYMGADRYVFELMDPLRPSGSRTPQIRNLYDVFQNILEDEATHVRVMSACADKTIIEALEKRATKPAFGKRF